MAQNVFNPILSKWTGKVGGLIYSVNSGKQIISTNVGNQKKDPKTYKQMVRRVQWANLINIWQAFRGLDAPSFVNKPNNYSDWNMFMKRNMGSHSVYLTKEMANMGGAVVSDYMITQGKLGTIEMVSNDSGVLVSDIDLGNLTIGSSTTVAAFSIAVISNNGNRFQQGDKISCFIAKQFTDQTSGIPSVKIIESDIVLDISDSDMLLRDTATAAAFSNVGTKLGLSAAVEGGAAYVHSRNTANGTDVSTQNMVVTNTALATYQTTAALSNAILSYGGRMTTDYLVPGENNIEAPVTNP